VALDRDAIWSVVHDGALATHGMPQFPALTRDDVDKIYAYIRQQTREAARAANAR
jgi:hypothetical protein